MPTPLPSHLPNSQKHPDSDHVESLSRLGDDITQMAAHLDAGTYQLLELIGEFDEKGGWHGIGINSCAHWLNWNKTSPGKFPRKRHIANPSTN